MPTYDYACQACGHEFEEFQSMSAKPLKKCPTCGRMKLQRLIGTGAGIIFKGSGFYETDYRSESYKKSADAEKKGDSGDKTDASKSDAKGDAAKSETKSTDAAKSRDTTSKPAGDANKSTGNAGKKSSE